MGAHTEKVKKMYTVAEVPFDSLPDALQALFTVESKIFTPSTATDSSEPEKTTHIPDTREQTASRAHSCSEIIAQCDAIEVHEIAIETIDPESFALDVGEW